MGAHVQCPRCEQAYALSDEQALLYAGREFECAQCTLKFIIPPASIRLPHGELPRGQLTAAAVRSPAAMALAYPGWGASPYSSSGEPPILSARLAAASMICGIIGLLVPIVPGLLAIILGIWAVQRVYRGKAEGASLAAGGIAVGAAGLIVSTALFYDRILPAMTTISHSPVSAAVCSDHFKKIDGALAKYAAEHAGSFPDGLNALIANGQIGADVLICPLSDDRNAVGKTPAEIAKRVAAGKHSSYIYVGRGLTTRSPPECVLLYEPLKAHDKDGIHVLFIDGRVREIGSIEAAKAVTRLSNGQNPPWSN